MVAKRVGQTAVWLDELMAVRKVGLRVVLMAAKMAEHSVDKSVLC